MAPRAVILVLLAAACLCVQTANGERFTGRHLLELHPFPHGVLGPPGPKPSGASCASNSECAGRLCLREVGAPSGTCKDCKALGLCPFNAPCSADNDCGSKNCLASPVNGQLQCQKPKCMFEANGNESKIFGRCLINDRCAVDQDCITGHCGETNAVCRRPKCSRLCDDINRNCGLGCSEGQGCADTDDCIPGAIRGTDVLKCLQNPAAKNNPNNKLCNLVKK